MSEEFYVGTALSVTYFFGTFAFTICKSTLIDMNCISSFAVINLAVASISWVILLILNKIYMSPTAPPVAYRYRLLGGFLQVVTFLLSSYASQNSSSIEFTACIIAIPFSVAYSVLIKKKKIKSQTMFSIILLFFGSVFISISNPVTSFWEILIATAIAILSTLEAFLIDHVMKESGLIAIAYLESISGPRTAIATIISASMIIREPALEINISTYTYSIFLLLAAVSCDLACAASQSSMIARTSPVSFIMTKQFCKNIFVFLCNTLSPTRFSTFHEAVFSFIGFTLALPAQLLFVTVGFYGIPVGESDIREDTEPFKINDSVDSSTLEEEEEKKE
jgi:hypothetical protein